MKRTTIVIFGASGDLARRKIIPALFNLYIKDRLPENFLVLGSGSRKWTHQDLRFAALQGVEKNAKFEYARSRWEEFASRLFYQPGDLTKSESFAQIGRVLSELEKGPANRMYYMATPPRFFARIAAGLGRAGLTSEDEGWRRVVVEKPFGNDLSSARALTRAIRQVLSEYQIFRIDHYLGKETVQNLLVFRFANSIFEPIWNRSYIDHVQITVAEEVGVGHRARYYDGVGVVRDMFQNHLLQLLTMVAMEPPASFEAEALHNEKAKVLKAIRPISIAELAENTVRGQYRGYREEDGIAKDSKTATFAAIRLFIDNWRWQGVPFYLRSGKRMAEKWTEIIIQFNCPPHIMFPRPPDFTITPNIIGMCLQPDEGIHLRFEAKVPDTVAEMRSVDMDFHYADSFGASSIPEAYERLLLDVLSGDAALFTRSDQIEIAWGLVDPIIAGWQKEGVPPLASYEPGSWGPPEADALLARDGRRWLQVCGIHA